MTKNLEIPAELVGSVYVIRPGDKVAVLLPPFATAHEIDRVLDRWRQFLGAEVLVMSNEMQVVVLRQEEAA